MGRLATSVAAAFVDADNMPNPPPNISILDALLPRRVVSALVGPAKKDDQVQNKLRRVSNASQPSNPPLASSVVSLPPTPTHKPARRAKGYRKGCGNGKPRGKGGAEGCENGDKARANATPSQRSTNTSKTKVRYWDVSPTKRGFVARKATSPEKKEANAALDAKVADAKVAKDAKDTKPDNKAPETKPAKPASVMHFGGGAFGGAGGGGGFGGAGGWGADLGGGGGGGPWGGLGGGGGGGWEQVGAGTWNKPVSDKAKGDKDDKKPMPGGFGTALGGAAAAKSGDGAWTAEEDAKLRELKAAGKSWKEIAEALPGRPQWQLKARFKEIGKDGVVGGAGAGAAAAAAAVIRGGGGSDKLAGAGVKRDEGGDKKSAKAGSPAKAVSPAKGMAGMFGTGDDVDKKEEETGKKLTKKEKKAVKAAAVGAANADAKDHDNKPFAFDAGPAPGVVPAAAAEIRIMDEDDMFSFDELACLVEILDAEPAASWTRLVARFYNKTGRRVRPDDVRDKLEFWCAV